MHLHVIIVVDSETFIVEHVKNERTGDAQNQEITIPQEVIDEAS